MQIKELLQVVNYLKEIAGNPAFLDMYKELASAAREASVNPGIDFTKKIAGLKEDLQRYLLKSDPAEWGYSSYKLFEKLNSANLFGKPASEHLENLVNHGSRDYNTVHAELNKRIKLLARFSDNLTKFSNLFNLILPADKLTPEENSELKATIFLYFEGHLSVQSISDLERYSRLWDGILEAFCNLTGEDKPAVEITSFSDGNLILGVAAGEKTLKSISRGTDDILICLKNILKIKKIQQELTDLPVRNDIFDLLDEETELLIHNAAYKSARTLAENISVEDDTIISNINRSLKQILSFIEKGGKIEYNAGFSPDPVMSRNLSDSFLAARELEKLTSYISNARLNRAKEMEA